MSNLEFPCPVLGNGDNYTKDALLTFEDDVVWIRENNGVILKVPFPSITDKKIESHFREGELSMFLEISSPATYFHDVISIDYNYSSAYVFEKFFKIGILNKKVSYTFYLASRKNFFITPDKLSLDYPPTFRAIEFDIIAKTKKDEINIDHEFDPYSSAQDSFMVITSNHDSKKNQTIVDFSQDRIIIKLPEETYNNYQSLNKSHSDILHSSIVLPVLCQAISYVNSQDKLDDYDQLIWYERLNQIIEVNGYHNLEPLNMAMKILKNPLARGIKYLALKSARDEEVNDI